MSQHQTMFPSSGGLFGVRNQEPSKAELLKKEAFRQVGLLSLPLSRWCWRFPMLTLPRITLSQLKPKCVPLMGIQKFSRLNYQHDLGLLDDLLATLRTLPNEAYIPSIMNYAIFPLTHLLQRNNPVSTEASSSPSTPGHIPDRILERLFECLTFLIQRWKRTPNGIDANMWEQLWTLSALLLGGPLQPYEPKGKQATGVLDKGKGRELAEETQIAILGLLSALLIPISETVPVNEEDDDDGFIPFQPVKRVHPTPEILDRLFNTSKILPPILFHTVSALLELSRSPTAGLDVVLPSLDILRSLVTSYLRDKIEMLASLMPGMVSSLVKIVNTGTGGGGKPVKAQVAIAAMGLLQDILLGTLRDQALLERGVLKPEVTRLDQLAEDVEDDLMNGSQPLNTSQPDDLDQEAPSIPPSKPEAFPRLTPQYLEFTSAQLATSFRVILPALQRHSSPDVRIRLAEVCRALVSSCKRSLDSLQPLFLGTLLHLSLDDHDRVSAAARSCLDELLTSSKTASAMRMKLKQIAEQSLAAFPRAIMSQSQIKALDAAHIITALSNTVSVFTHMDHTTRMPELGVFSDLLGPTGGVQKWIWPLLTCLELARQKDMSTGATSTGYADRAWQMARLGTSFNHLQIKGSRVTGQGNDEASPEPSNEHAENPSNVEFPRLYLRHADSPQVLDATTDMFEALGSAAGLDALYTVEQLITIARAKRHSTDVPKATSALWIADQVLTGLAESSSESVHHRQLRKTAKLIVKMLVSFQEQDDNDDEHMQHSHAPDSTGAANAEELAVVERQQGINSLTSLLKRDYRGAPKNETTNRAIHLEQHRQLMTALSMSVMSTCARILGSSFRPLLLETLYIILSHLGSPHLFIRGYAETALVRIAYDIGYASPQNLIMDNVDYVINVVSQRMTYKRLSPLAPMVLISMIRLVGEPIVPLVQDIVDDVFDCLDSFHGYETLASTMLAVLDTLMRAMTPSEADMNAWTPPESTSRAFRPGPNPTRDFEKLVEWYQQRATKTSEAVDSFLKPSHDPTPHEPWGENGDGAAPEEDNNATRDEPEIPMTRTQTVCQQVMEKSIFFMTHRSPFLRARVLALFATGIPILVMGNRQHDLLPLVNTSWPYVLNRLKDAEPFVVTQAAGLIEALARWVGDFMSRRILDHAWPVFKRLLEVQGRLDQQSSLVKKASSSSYNDNSHQGIQSFTTSHRLYMSIIQATRYVITQVPISDSIVWEIILSFRSFLSAHHSREVQDAVIELYRAIKVRNEDAVWLGLWGTIGAIEGKSVAYLRQPGWDITENVERVMSI